jgi:hypothetical protein
MKKKILVGLLLAGSTVFAAPRVSFGISIGAPGPVVVAPPIVAAAPPCPGPGYTFVDGYWQNFGGRRVWQAGFWRAPVRIERSHEQFEHRDRFDRGERSEHAEHFRR